MCMRFSLCVYMCVYVTVCVCDSLSVYMCMFVCMWGGLNRIEIEGGQEEARIGQTKPYILRDELGFMF